MRILRSCCASKTVRVVVVGLCVVPLVAGYADAGAAISSHVSTTLRPAAAAPPTTRPQPGKLAPAGRPSHGGLSPSGGGLAAIEPTPSPKSASPTEPTSPKGSSPGSPKGTSPTEPTSPKGSSPTEPTSPKGSSP